MIGERLGVASGAVEQGVVHGTDVTASGLACNGFGRLGKKPRGTGNMHGGVSAISGASLLTIRKDRP